MTVEVRMPALGESIVEGTIVRWLKQPGEKVERDEELLLVSTDKIEAEIPAPAAGTLLSHLHAEGALVPVGEVLALIAAEGESVSAPAPTAAPAPETSSPAAAPQATSAGTPVAGARVPVPSSEEPARGPGKHFASPVVRRLLAEHGLSLSAIEGTGRHGRVSRRDVERFLEDRRVAPGASPVAPAASVPPQAAALSQPLAGYVAPVSAASQSRYQARLLPGSQELGQSPMQRAMAEHMQLTWAVTPHVSTVTLIDMTRIVRHREANKARFAARGQGKLTYTHYIARCVGQALADNLNFNVSVTPDRRILQHRAVNLSVAVSTPEGGLVVPVLRNADERSLAGVARGLNELAEKARTRSLAAADFAGGTFTITNVGSNGNLYSVPLINQPQAAILAVGTIHKQPVVRTVDGEDVIAIRSVMYATLTYDHRANDGARSGRFLKQLRGLLEGFDEAL